MSLRAAICLRAVPQSEGRNLPLWLHRAPSLCRVLYCLSASVSLPRLIPSCGSAHVHDWSSLPIMARQIHSPTRFSLSPFLCSACSLQGHPSYPSSCSPCVLSARVLGTKESGSRDGGPASCSPASLDTGPVDSTVQTDHSLLQPDILAIPSCPVVLIWFGLRGHQQIDGISLQFADLIFALL
jgi:hypothetical protein